MSQRQLSNSEQSAFKGFCKRVKDVDLLAKYPKLDNEVFLLRFLVARDFNLERAEDMLKKHLQWRKENDIETISEWQPPEDMVTAFPYELDTVDKEGRPIVSYGMWDARKFLDQGREKEYLKFVNYFAEKLVAAIKPPATQFTLVLDASNVSFANMMHRKSMEVGLKAMRVFEENYPEYMHKCTVVNCPKIYYYIFAMAKHLMSEQTLSKMELHDANREKWTKSLLESIDENQLPKLIMQG